MTLDNEQQRKFLLEMMQQVSFPGAVLEVAHSVLCAIKAANVDTKVSASEPTIANSANPICADR